MPFWKLRAGTRSGDGSPRPEKAPVSAPTRSGRGKTVVTLMKKSFFVFLHENVMMKRGAPEGAPAVLLIRLLAFAVLDYLIDLGFYGFKVEGRWCLHRWILDGRFRELRHIFLNHDEAPELSRIEVVHVPAAEFIQGFTSD